ncbi:MAG: GNAT family N-acetyltransferase [Polyangiales bacterium]
MRVPVVEVPGYLIVTLGFSFERGGRDGFIDELFIDARFRGHRLGREAIAVAEAYCTTRGFRYCTSKWSSIAPRLPISTGRAATSTADGGS